MTYLKRGCRKTRSIRARMSNGVCVFVLSFFTIVYGMNLKLERIKKAGRHGSKEHSLHFVMVLGENG